jgi:UDP-2,3-diacylglucosamine pyrophosphatase LpxH
MLYTQDDDRGPIRSVFVSDVHLGCRYAQAEKFFDFLSQTHPDHLYIVGDFIDGWRLKKRWHWQAVYMRIFQRLMTLASQGTQIYYAPGNHDAFLHEFHRDFGLITISDQFIHVGADDRQYVVVHGDRFDNIEQQARWLSLFGSFAYDFLVWANDAVNRLRRWWHLEECKLSSRVKVCVKQAVQFISDFETRLIEHAQAHRCDGVICGHIHFPRICRIQDVLYCNTGDWVEHCTAVVEYASGELELLDRSQSRPAQPRRVPTPWDAAEEQFEDALALARVAQTITGTLAGTEAAVPTARWGLPDASSS